MMHAVLQEGPPVRDGVQGRTAHSPYPPRPYPLALYGPETDVDPSDGSVDDPSTQRSETARCPTQAAMPVAMR
jgi:hypothetical protein